ncbi:hypothetical protein Glove_343g6 [Diversispora epigaea]|uniref:Uncharacterized protein n=1 Tax=Diversispora epigaea TaxID=1348612 RepID=A0A397HGA3_9GLOM|nr:hypothetical protein Glove_343g6 [Diversispora epigaea]
MKTIQRKAIIKRRVTEELHKTPTALIYTSKLFEFKLLEASIFFEQQKKNPDLTENMIKGFAKFLECLDLFFDINIAIAMDDAELFEYQSDNGTSSVNFFKRKPSKSFTPITFEYLQHKRNIYKGYWYRKPSFLLIKRNTSEVIDIDNLQ